MLLTRHAHSFELNRISAKRCLCSCPYNKSTCPDQQRVQAQLPNTSVPLRTSQVNAQEEHPAIASKLAYFFVIIRKYSRVGQSGRNSIKKCTCANTAPKFSSFLALGFTENTLCKCFVHDLIETKRSFRIANHRCCFLKPIHNSKGRCQVFL